MRQAGEDGAEHQRDQEAADHVEEDRRDGEREKQEKTAAEGFLFAEHGRDPSGARRRRGLEWRHAETDQDLHPHRRRRLDRARLGTRISKDDLRVECYGTVDELNAQLGVALCRGLPEPLAAPLSQIQNDLFHLGADLCVTEAEKAARPMPRIEERHVAWLEAQIDLLEREARRRSRTSSSPAASPAAAHLHVARTVCRRAERILVTLAMASRSASGRCPISTGCPTCSSSTPGRRTS